MYDNYVVEVDILDAIKRLKPSKHYVYKIQVKWSNNNVLTQIFRRYSQFFELQCNLLDRFENIDNFEHERVLPYLPGKVLMQPSHVKKIALERIQPLNEYLKRLISLPSNYSRCYFALKFFQITNDDIEFQLELESLANRSLLDDGNNSILNENSLISTPLALKEYFFLCEYTCKNAEREEVSFKRNDRVLLIKKYLNGWCWIEHAKQQFCVPYNYIESTNMQEKDEKIILSQHEMCLITNDYKAQKNDEFSLTKGTRIEIIEKSYTGWWKARLEDGSIGYVPGIYLSPIKSTPNRIDEYSTGYQSFPSSSFNGLSFRESPCPSKISRTKPPRPPPPATTTQKEKYLVTESYKSFTLKDLNVSKGDEVILIEKLNAYQWRVQLENGQTGLVPSFILQKFL